MMHAIVGAADAAGEPLIALLGDCRFYSRFGFVAASRLGINPPNPEWGAHFRFGR
jgi:putative acetyltransferase